MNGTDIGSVPSLFLPKPPRHGAAGCPFAKQARHSLFPGCNIGKWPGPPHEPAEFTQNNYTGFTEFLRHWVFSRGQEVVPFIGVLLMLIVRQTKTIFWNWLHALSASRKIQLVQIPQQQFLGLPLFTENLKTGSWSMSWGDL